jgi:hypothetical protein
MAKKNLIDLAVHELQRGNFDALKDVLKDALEEFGLPKEFQDRVFPAFKLLVIYALHDLDLVDAKAAVMASEDPLTTLDRLVTAAEGINMPIKAGDAPSRRRKARVKSATRLPCALLVEMPRNGSLVRAARRDGGLRTDRQPSSRVPALSFPRAAMTYFWGV